MKRKAVVVGAALIAFALIAGVSCSTGDGGISIPSVRPRPTTTTTAPLAPSVAWAPTPSEIEVDVKRAASDTVRVLFSYGAGEGTVDAARIRLQAAPVTTVDIAAKAAPLLRAVGRGAADVVYPQLGGLTASRASVMVVTNFRWQDTTVDSEMRTIDIRLLRTRDGWRVEDIASLGGTEPKPGTLSEAARAVIDDPRIQLPDSARGDIESGIVDDRVLRAMTKLAMKAEIKVVTLKAGHPLQVFGSSSTSNHIRGRAVDIWWFGGPIVEQRSPNGALRPVIRELLGEGVTELGAPFDIDGGRGANFTDVVHQDHLHIGFDR